MARDVSTLAAVLRAARDTVSEPTRPCTPRISGPLPALRLDELVGAGRDDARSTSATLGTAAAATDTALAAPAPEPRRRHVLTAEDVDEAAGALLQQTLAAADHRVATGQTPRTADDQTGPWEQYSAVLSSCTEQAELMANTPMHAESCLTQLDGIENSGSAVHQRLAARPEVGPASAAVAEQLQALARALQVVAVRHATVAVETVDSLDSRASHALVALQASRLSLCWMQPDACLSKAGTAANLALQCLQHVLSAGAEGRAVWMSRSVSARLTAVLRESAAESPLVTSHLPLLSETLHTLAQGIASKDIASQAITNGLAPALATHFGLLSSAGAGSRGTRAQHATACLDVLRQAAAAKSGAKLLAGQASLFMLQLLSVVRLFSRLPHVVLAASRALAKLTLYEPARRAVLEATGMPVLVQALACPHLDLGATARLAFTVGNMTVSSASARLALATQAPGMVELVAASLAVVAGSLPRPEHGTASEEDQMAALDASIKCTRAVANAAVLAENAQAVLADQAFVAQVLELLCLALRQATASPATHSTAYVELMWNCLTLLSHCAFHAQHAQAPVLQLLSEAAATVALSVLPAAAESAHAMSVLEATKALANCSALPSVAEALLGHGAVVFTGLLQVLGSSPSTAAAHAAAGAMVNLCGALQASHAVLHGGIVLPNGAGRAHIAVACAMAARSMYHDDAADVALELWRACANAMRVVVQAGHEAPMAIDDVLEVQAAAAEVKQEELVALAEGESSPMRDVVEDVLRCSLAAASNADEPLRHVADEGRYEALY